MIRRIVLGLLHAVATSIFTLMEVTGYPKVPDGGGEEGSS